MSVGRVSIVVIVEDDVHDKGWSFVNVGERREERISHQAGHV
jgi:hypothetical protein